MPEAHLHAAHGIGSTCLHECLLRILVSWRAADCKLEHQTSILMLCVVSRAGVPVTSVKFDYSGQYLAVGGQDARVYGVKQDWGLLSTMTDLPKKVSMPGQAMLAG